METGLKIASLVAMCFGALAIVSTVIVAPMIYQEIQNIAHELDTEMDEFKV